MENYLEKDSYQIGSQNLENTWKLSFPATVTFPVMEGEKENGDICVRHKPSLKKVMSNSRYYIQVKLTKSDSMDSCLKYDLEVFYGIILITV